MRDYSPDREHNPGGEAQQALDALDADLARGQRELALREALPGAAGASLGEPIANVQAEAATFFQPPVRAVTPAPAAPPAPDVPAPPPAGVDLSGLAASMQATVEGILSGMPAAGHHGPQLAHIACPDCGAPLAQPPAAGQVVRCDYCGASFTIERAHDESERVQAELRRWLDSVVAVGAAGGTVDAASRRFIFRERLFPALRLELDRHLETFDALRGAGLCCLRTQGLFATGLRLVGVDTGALRRVVSRLDAPEVRAFAVVPEDQFQLDDLVFRATVTLRLGTTQRLLGRGGARDYEAAHKNVEAAAQLARGFAASPQAPAAQRAFLHAVAQRLAGGAALLRLIGRILAAPPGALAGETDALAALERTLAHAEQELGGCGYEPIEVVAVQRGLASDRDQLRLIGALVRAYDAVAAQRGEPLPAFMERFERFAQRVGLRPATIDQLVAFLELLAPSASAAAVATVADWAAVDAAVESGRQHGGLFSKGEMLDGRRDYWHPFYCFPVAFSIVKGGLFKGGVEERGYALVSAVGTETPAFIPGGAATSGSWQSAAFGLIEQRTSGSAADGRDLALPLRAAADARRSANGFLQGVATIRNARLSPPLLLFVSATIAQYTGRGVVRRICLTPLGEREADAAVVLDAYAQLAKGP